MSRWPTIEDLKNSKVAEINDHLIDPAKINYKLRQKSVKILKKDPEALRHIKQILWMLKIDFVTEYQFHPARKFRFDIAIIDKKIAIEYEGIISEKNGHTSIDGYSDNCRKYNQTVIYGWTLLRYTVLTYKEFFSEINDLINV